MTNNNSINTIEINGKTIDLMHADSLPSGYGHRKITVQLCYGAESGYFRATTNCMPCYDEAMNIEDYDAQKMALYGIIASDIEDQIIEWLYEIEEKAEDGE